MDVSTLISQRDWSAVYDTPVFVGEGAQASVFRLKRKDADVCEALKVYTSENIWKREKEALAMADHPLFPEMLEADSEDGLFYIRMEYIWGERLDEVLERRGGFAQQEAMKMALTVADGLGWLQQQDGTILFRDLKAENLLLQPDGCIRLVDFGSACRMYEASEVITGTVGYSPKEQLGGGKVGTYSDVYAFGRLFDFMLTGKNPIHMPIEKRESLQSYDPAISLSLELLIRDCTLAEGARRIPSMYGVVKRMVDIASCNAKEYRKLEKESAKILENYSADVVFEKDIMI